MATQPPVTLSIEVNQRDIDRISKNLAKWEKAPLEKRMEKAVQGGAKLLVNPIRAAAAPRSRTGLTVRRVRVKKLKKRPGEATAYVVGSGSPYYARARIGGPYGAPPDNYVMQAFGTNEERVVSFISEQIKKLT
jgi:hypothetical protein